MFLYKRPDHNKTEIPLLNQTSFVWETITHKTVPLVIEKFLALSIRTANYKPLSFQENCMKGGCEEYELLLKIHIRINQHPLSAGTYLKIISKCAYMYFDFSQTKTIIYLFNMSCKLFSLTEIISAQ